MNSSSENRSTLTYPCRYWKGAYHQENYISTIAAIILNMLTCPMTVFINALVIVAVIKKRRLQTTYNILLACLAATDLVVGIVVQPSFIVGEMSLITGSSLADYCRLFRQTVFILITPSQASLLLLALLSIERYLALKYPFRYMEIVTNFRLTVAVILSWIAAVFPLVARYIPSLAYKASLIALALDCVSLLVIIYCHIFVYLVTRRHRIQIQTEQVSQDAKMKFLEEKKASITTSIIIGFVLLSYLPVLVYMLIGRIARESYLRNLFESAKPLLLSCFLINSLCNPIIYCWRSSDLRKAFLELLRRSNNAG